MVTIVASVAARSRPMRAVRATTPRRSVGDCGSCSATPNAGVTPTEMLRSGMAIQKPSGRAHGGQGGTPVAADGGAHPAQPIQSSGVAAGERYRALLLRDHRVGEWEDVPDELVRVDVGGPDDRVALRRHARLDLGRHGLVVDDNEAR